MIQFLRIIQIEIELIVFNDFLYICEFHIESLLIQQKKSPKTIFINHKYNLQSGREGNQNE